MTKYRAGELGIATTAAGDLLDALVAALPGGGEARASQVEMTSLVTEALVTGGQLAVRAGTGTGKSLAVLAAVAAAGTRTVIATATKALQDQYAYKELPFVAEHHHLDWAVLKGRINYACMARLAEARSVMAGAADSGAQESFFESRTDAEQATEALSASSQRMAVVFEWVTHTDTGDLSELPFELDWNTLQWVATGPDGCPGAEKCAFSRDCFSEKAGARARQAQVVLVNTALLGADLSTDGALLGDAEAYVVDEAHEAEDILAVAFGAELQPNDLLRLERHVRVGIGGEEDLRGALRRSAAALESELRTAAGEVFRDGFPESGPLALSVHSAAQVVTDVRRRARRAVKEDPADGGAEACRRSADRLFESIDRLSAEGSVDAIWVEEQGRRIRRVPIDVGDRLSEQAWGEHGVVLTSASVSRSLADRVGLADPGVFHDVGTPFDHREAAWLYVPALLRHHPPRERTPNHPDWFDEAFTEAAAVIDAAEGRTLMLCTSMRNAQAMAERARKEMNWPVLVQGEAPKAKLLAEFAADEHAVAVGTMGLWQGVDVAGTSLSCVIIDKIPFPRPDDPLWQARSDHVRRQLTDAGLSDSDAGYQAFLAVQVPRAASLMAQGAGRLIRTATDRGLVVVLDPRLAEKAYRGTILAEMPPMRRTRSRSDALRHLRSGLD